MENDRREILLKEYELCQHDNQAESTRFWLIFSIFISINTALIGGLAYGIFNTNFINDLTNTQNVANIQNTIASNISTNITFSANAITSTTTLSISSKLLILTILLVAIGLITYLLRFWLGRSNYLMQNYLRRMREIEIELGMWKNITIHIFDKWNSIRETLKYKINPCTAQNNLIWIRVWKELEEELSKEQYDTLFVEKARIESLSNIKKKRYFHSNRYNAYVIFWAIGSLWVVLLAYLWIVYFSQSAGFWSYLIYVPVFIGIAQDFYDIWKKEFKS